MDAVIVGAGTVRADDPLLTARPPGPRAASRVVLSRTGVLPEGCQLLRTADRTPVVVATVGRSRVVPPPDTPGVERIAESSLSELLAELGGRRMTNVLVEGGSEVFASFFAARLVDELHIFIAPRVLGGRDALPPVGGHSPPFIRDAYPLARWESERVGDDVYLHGWMNG
jgi:diaminohydroxyphosphoribosylaminopyrimidine deaminase/5-amino-6-(5-phosphoribosylamino)uracil reductase